MPQQTTLPRASCVYVDGKLNNYYKEKDAGGTSFDPR
jgi:hypothetical protein